MNIINKIVKKLKYTFYIHKLLNNIKNNGGQAKLSQLSIYGNLKFGKGFIINDKGIDTIQRSQVVVRNGAELSFGNFSGISSTSIYCTNKISIGNYVNIGAGCLIMDSNFHSLNWTDRKDRNTDCINARTAPIEIGDYVFIGARSIICKGIKIGEKSIVAAGSVVVTDIPKKQIWGGNPAKFIKLID